MSKGWGIVYAVGIWVTGGLVTLSILLAWARSFKKYWMGEMNRRQQDDKTGN